MTHGKRIEKLIRRLEKTSGRRTARRNARNAMKSELRVVWRDLDKLYPPIRKDGTEVVREKRRGAFCVACKTPMKNFAALAKHMGTKHGRRCIVVDGEPMMRPGSFTKCWCGKAFPQTAIVRHLANIKDLEAHCTLGALGEGGPR